MKKVTVREFLEMEVDIDVYDDYTDELGIAFCGPAELTDAGQKYFEDIMDLNVTLVMDDTNYTDYAIVEIDELDNPDEALDKLTTLFYGLAGYINESQYDEWFR